MYSDRPEIKRTIISHTVLLGLVALLVGWWNPPLLPCVFGLLLLGRSKSPAGRKKYRAWLRLTAYSLAIGLTLVTLFNYTIDPLWCFNHRNRWNAEQVGFNERLQKTNLVTFRDFDYRSLLIGSSRVAVLDQNQFRGKAAFNYAAATMVPDEYGDYIRYARKQNGKTFTTILIGMDFFGTNANYQKRFEKPEYYFSEANSFLYRYKMLLTYDTLRFSKNNLNAGGSEVRGTYNRGNVRTPKLGTREGRENLVRNQLFWFSAIGYGNNYHYDGRLREKLRRVREDNPGANFVVFTMPVSKPLFCLMVKNNRLPDYERWLRDLVDVFGAFYNFMDLNTVTRDYLRTFSDCDHLYPETGTLLAHRVLGIPDDSLPADFGKLVTRQNIDEIIASIQAQCTSCR
ncbi:MAG: hypothetical protein PHO83_05360 [Geobacteraceae bacterium]|nr:hypothetical protein [Geobacteraceae bacterium]